MKLGISSLIVSNTSVNRTVMFFVWITVLLSSSKGSPDLNWAHYKLLRGSIFVFNFFCGFYYKISKLEKNNRDRIKEIPVKLISVLYILAFKVFCVLLIGGSSAQLEKELCCCPCSNQTILSFHIFWLRNYLADMYSFHFPFFQLLVLYLLFIIILFIEHSGYITVLISHYIYIYIYI